MKFKNIIFENSESDWGYKKSYIKLFKLLLMKGFNPNNINGVYLFLKKELSFKSEESSRIALLYQKNYDPDGNYENLTPETWVIPQATNVSERLMALSSYFDVTPLIFKPESGSNLGDRYVPLIDMCFRNYLIDGAIITEVDNLNSEAHDTILYKLEQEGWDYFDDHFLEKYLEVDNRKLEYNVREIVLDEYKNYLSKEGSLRESSKEGLLENIGLIDEYLDHKDTLEELLKEIKPIENENIIIQSKVDKLEVERNNVEIEIERLSDTIDYGEEDEYHGTYRGDIDELEELLNKIEYKIYYYNNELSENETILNKLNSELEYAQTDLEVFEGDNLKELYLERRMEELIDEYENDILQYIYDAGLTVDEAIDDRLVYIDEETAIREAIESDGPLEHIDYEGSGYELDQFGYNDEDYVVLIDTYRGRRGQDC